MANCENFLWDQVRAVEPTATQKNGARRSQNFLRDILCTGNMAPRIKTHYLSGSYARDTAVYPLDDVDIIFIIEPEHWPHDWNFLFGTERFPKTSAVLESFARAIRYRYRDSSVFEQRRSIRLQLYHLDVDVVPAIQHPNDSRFILIPDHHANDWILSSPILHAEKATSANKFQNGQLKPLIKLLKYWNGQLPSTARLKSFAIETMCVRIFEQLPMKTLQDGLHYFFDFVSSFSGRQSSFRWTTRYGISLGWLSPKVPDTANTGSNIIARIENERREKFIEHATRSCDRIVRAFEAKTTHTACSRLAEALRI